MLVEADGKRVFYSGDFRAHGRKAKLVEQLIADPPQDVDLLLMEGTTLGRPDSDRGFPTEDDLVPRFVELFEQSDGLPLVWASGQNIDRLVTLYKACRRAGRQLIIDVYTAHMLRATGNPPIPQAGWRDLRVFLPASQRARIKRDGTFELANIFRPYRVFPEQLPALAEHAVMLFRPSMMRDIARIDGLRVARLICSVWRGYLEEGRNRPLLDWIERSGIPLAHCHTSGHAAQAELAALRRAFGDARAVLIHTDAPRHFKSVFGNVVKVGDNVWLNIKAGKGGIQCN